MHGGFLDYASVFGRTNDYPSLKMLHNFYAALTRLSRFSQPRSPDQLQLALTASRQSTSTGEQS